MKSSSAFKTLKVVFAFLILMQLIGVINRGITGSLLSETSIAILKFRVVRKGPGSVGDPGIAWGELPRDMHSLLES